MTGGETGRATSGLGPDLIAQRGFMVVRRGFDQEEVRAFLDQVAAEVRALDRRVAALTDELAAAKAAAARAADAAPVAPAEAVTAAPAERAPLDLDEVVALVGEETASVLRAARSAAVDLRRRAEAEAERIVGDARQASSSMRLEAEGLLVKTAADAEATVEQSRQAARTEADAIVARARADADAVREQAEQERRRTVDGAQAVREKILADLSRRRRVATVQIEQLRAGRERLLESYAVVPRTLDVVHE
ncbi:MAG TPA: DivIVA domain-containing protein [Acidimicrobiales bacterium]|nr:DivIVA domain-containing protein [Acidimicrobiales bacterium]